MFKKKYIKLFFVFIVVFSIGIFTYLFFHLDVGTKPVKADVIVVIEGSYERATLAANLLEAGFSKSNKIIVTPLTSKEYDYTEQYSNLNIPRNDLIIDNKATSTWTNATNTIELMKENNYNSALVITSDYHTRRTRLAFNRAGEESGMTFNIVSAYVPVNGKKASYLEHNKLNIIGREIISYIGYVFHLYYLIDL